MIMLSPPSGLENAQSEPPGVTVSFNPVAIEHPMVPEELRHSVALGNSVRSADIARVVHS